MLELCPIRDPVSVLESNSRRSELVVALATTAGVVELGTETLDAVNASGSFAGRSPAVGVAVVVVVGDGGDVKGESSIVTAKADIEKISESLELDCIGVSGCCIWSASVAGKLARDGEGTEGSEDSGDDIATACKLDVTSAADEIAVVVVVAFPVAIAAEVTSRA